MERGAGRNKHENVTQSKRQAAAHLLITVGDQSTSWPERRTALSRKGPRDWPATGWPAFVAHEYRSGHTGRV